LLRLRSKLALGGQAQVLHFFGIKLAEFARLKIKHQWTIANAPDLLHVVPNLFEHLSQLAVAPLDQRDFVPWIIALAHEPDACRGRVHLARSRSAAVNGHTPA